MNKKEFGDFGEHMAEKYLEMSGYEILERKFACRLGEIDLIARKENTISFIEVKTRASLDYGTPAEAVGKEKKNKIRKVAALYMMWEKITNYQVRFDVVEIYCNHIENAF